MLADNSLCSVFPVRLTSPSLARLRPLLNEMYDVIIMAPCVSALKVNLIPFKYIQLARISVKYNTAVLSKKAVTAKSPFRDKLKNIGCPYGFAVTAFLLSTADI